MPVPVPNSLINFINTGSKFLIAGHKEPDGDCVGSMLALCSALARLGKETIPCSPGPFKRSEIIPFAGRFVAVPDESWKKGAKLIIVDCNEIIRTGMLAPHLEGLPVFFIDHHEIDEKFPAESEIYHDPGSPAVTLMIFSLIEALGLELSREEAELLLFGLCTDTGFFRHVDSGGEEIFTAASRLIKAGADPKKAFIAIHGGKSLESRYLIGQILCRAKPYFNGRLLVSYEDYNDICQYGPESRDSDSIYQLLQSVEGVQAVVIVRQENPGECTVGLRSIDPIDVSAIAAAMGGGGHINAAGFSTKDDISNIIKKTINAFSGIFQ